MNNTARRWRILGGGLSASIVASMAGVLGLAGPTAAADPLYPVPPQPAPVIQQVPGAAVAPAATPLGIPPMVPAVPTAPVAQAAAPLAASPTAPGVQSLAATAAVPQALVPATAGTLADFLKSKGATLQPQSARDFKALNIVLPVPRGWSQVPDPNVPDAFAVIADRVGGDGIYTSNAALVVYKLVGGDFDPKEAITHGFIDSQQLPAWRTTKATLGDFGGMPSAAIEGTYRENNMSLNTSRRHTIATAGPDKYLVTLSVTTTVGEAVAAADATDAITNGFRISPVGPPR